MVPYWLTQLIFDGQIRWRMWRHGMSHREALLDLLHLEEEELPPPDPAPSSESEGRSTTVCSEKPYPRPAPVAGSSDRVGSASVLREDLLAQRVRELGRVLLAVRAVLRECAWRFSTRCLDCRLMCGQSGAAVALIDEVLQGMGLSAADIDTSATRGDIRTLLEATREEAVRFEAKCERRYGEVGLLVAASKTTGAERVAVSRKVLAFQAWIQGRICRFRGEIDSGIMGPQTREVVKTELSEAKAILDAFEETFATRAAAAPLQNSAAGSGAEGLDLLAYAFFKSLRDRAEAKRNRITNEQEDAVNDALVHQIKELEWVQVHYWRLFTQLTETGRQSG